MMKKCSHVKFAMALSRKVTVNVLIVVQYSKMKRKKFKPQHNAQALQALAVRVALQRRAVALQVQASPVVLQGSLAALQVQADPVALQRSLAALQVQASPVVLQRRAVVLPSVQVHQRAARVAALQVLSEVPVDVNRTP